MARQIVFRFNGDPTIEGSVLDPDDSMALPSAGERFNYEGELWDVAKVDYEAIGTVPTVRIYLYKKN